MVPVRLRITVADFSCSYALMIGSNPDGTESPVAVPECDNIGGRFAGPILLMEVADMAAALRT